jgi:uncharacterized protein YjiK
MYKIQISGIILSVYIILIYFMSNFNCINPGDKNSVKPVNAEKNYNKVGYDFSNPDEIAALPDILHEISGITEIDSSTIACVQDENGILFIYDLKKKRIRRQFFFHSDGDYEGIARIGEKIFILRSDGKLYEVSNYKVPGFTRIAYSTEIPSNDNEGLCYDRNKNRLLIAPKSKIGKDDDDKKKRVIYAFNLNTKKITEKPVIVFQLKEIKKYAVQNKVDVPFKKKKKGKKSKPVIDLRPSAIGIHPITNKLFVLSGMEQLIFVFNINGAIEYMEKLDPELFNQPEGIAFLDNGDLLVSNEGQSGKATLLRFNYKRK